MDSNPARVMASGQVVNISSTDVMASEALGMVP
jgi:hypothetical protein